MNGFGQLDAICKAALRLVCGLHQLECHGEIIFADCGLLPGSALMSAARMCWKRKLFTNHQRVSLWLSIPLQSQRFFLSFFLSFFFFFESTCLQEGWESLGSLQRYMQRHAEVSRDLTNCDTCSCTTPHMPQHTPSVIPECCGE